MILLVSGSQAYDDKRSLWDALDALHGNQIGKGDIALLRLAEPLPGAESLAHDWAVTNWVPMEIIYPLGREKENGPGRSRIILHRRVAMAQPKADRALFFGRDDLSLHLAASCRHHGIPTQYAPEPHPNRRFS